MRLINNAQSIQVETAGVPSSALHFYSNWTDKKSEVITPGNLTGTFVNAETQVVPAPAASTNREIEELSFYNAANANMIVTVSIVDGVNTRILKQSTLTAGQTLLYEVFSGWSVN